MVIFISSRSSTCVYPLFWIWFAWIAGCLVSVFSLHPSVPSVTPAVRILTTSLSSYLIVVMQVVSDRVVILSATGFPKRT